MIPAHRDFTHFNNEAIRFSWALTMNGAPYDMSVYDTVKMQIKAAPQSPVALVTFTPVASPDLQGLLISSLASGKLEGYAPQSTCADLVRTAVYDVVGYRGVNPEVIQHGEITFVSGVTR